MKKGQANTLDDLCGPIAVLCDKAISRGPNGITLRFALKRDALHVRSQIYSLRRGLKDIADFGKHSVNRVEMRLRSLDTNLHTLQIFPITTQMFSDIVDTDTGEKIDLEAPPFSELPEELIAEAAEIDQEVWRAMTSEEQAQFIARARLKVAAQMEDALRNLLS